MSVHNKKINSKFTCKMTSVMEKSTTKRFNIEMRFQEWYINFNQFTCTTLIELVSELFVLFWALGCWCRIDSSITIKRFVCMFVEKNYRKCCLYHKFFYAFWNGFYLIGRRFTLRGKYGNILVFRRSERSLKSLSVPVY